MEIRHALAAQTEHRSGLRAFGHGVFHLAVDRRHLDLRAEGSLYDGYGQLVENGRVLALKLRMAAHAHRYEQVARRTAVAPGVADALEELYAAGKVRAIGVDNFTQDKLADFVFWNKVKPAVNFVECNPFYQREAERTYMENKDIVMQAWSPLAAGQADFLANATLQTIAAAHEKSVAQVALRWQVQRGVVPIVKSANAQRMADNLKIFDFALTDAEMQEISKLDTGHTCFAPRQTGVAVEEFLENAKLYEL